MKNLPLLIFLTVYSFLTYSQTLIMNEVSQGVTGNMEYVEFVVVDNTAIYDCSSGQPPSIDIRGWIFDDNSGYHGTGGIAAGCIRFSFDPLWSAIPMGTIILIYNGAEPDPSIPPIDISLNDGNCSIVVPVTDVNLFESNPTTPGAVSCSYPTTGWIPGGNWSNTLLANTSDCARIVNLDGCEVFSVCWGADNLNNLIYFSGNAGNIVYYFNDSDPTIQANWTAGCTDNETILDANTCGSNDQTPGAPNNALNAAFIAQFNNGCTPIPPLVANAMIDNHEICGCDGSATATPSGSIPGYTYEWFDASMTPIGQTGITATSLCAGDYYVEITSSIGCQEIASVTVNPGSGIPSVTSVNGGASYCSSDPISNITATVTGTGPWDVTYTIDGGSTQNASGASSPIILGNTPGVYVVTGVTDANCSNTASGTQTITILPDNTITPASSNPIGCINTAIPNVTFTTTGATGIGAATGLPAGVTASFVGNTITVSGTPTASGTFNYSIPLTGGCGTVTATGTITVNAQNTIAAGTDETVCINTAITTISLTTTGATGAMFSGLPAGVTGTWSADVVTISGIPTASGTFNYTVTTTGGCPPATAAGTIDVNPAPVIGATGINPSSCAALDGSIDVTYTSGSGSTGLVSWTGPTSGSLGPQDIAVTNPDITGLGAGTFNVSFTDANGCISNVVPVNIVLPGAPTATITGVSGSYCFGITSGLDVTIELTGLGGPWNFTYTVDGVPTTITNYASPTFVITNATDGLYALTSVSEAGCNGTTIGTADIVEIPNNTVSASSSNPSVCINTAIMDVTFTTTGATGIGAATGLPAGVTASFAANTITVTGTPSAAGTFNYTIPLTGGCGLVDATGTINVYVTPTLDPIVDITACGSTALPNITGTDLNAPSYWTGPNQTGTQFVVGASFTTQGSTTLYAYDGANGCSDETSFVVAINPLPTVTGVNGSGTYCAGDVVADITMDVTGTGPWTVDYTLDGATMSANGATSPIVLGNTAGIYVVTNVTDANCTNTASGTQTITVNPNPGAPTAGNDSTYCSSWTLVPMTATGGTGTMTWYDDAALTGVITTGGSILPDNTIGTTAYYVTETENGCEGPASMVTITIENCNYVIPTAFTPNADGVHDDWEIYGLDVTYPNNVVRIYNRWGGLLYEHDSSVDGPYDSNRWKGDYNGEALPVGSYYYIIELNDEDKSVESGAVSILLAK